MKSIFKEDTFQEINKRLNQLEENTPRQWGKMTVAQMLHHCQAPFNVQMQKKDYGLKPNWLVKTFFKKSMYNDKLWSKGLPTPSAFKEKENCDFNNEKKVLQQLIDELYQQKNKQQWDNHPVFGYFTNEQWGKMQYKHLDHHLRQFGL